MGKVKLIENYSIHIPKENIEIFGENKERIIEAFNGGSFGARGILKNVPVTRFNKNKNGRIYSKNLWENVKKQGLFEKASCFANHAPDENDVTKTCGVWHNFKVLEDIAVADLYCVGELGQLMLEIANSNGVLGVSTCGFGELLENQEGVVNPDTYEFSNCDWVHKPSQDVYATSENIVTEQEIKENIEKNNKKLNEQNEEFTNKKDNELKETENIFINKEGCNMINDKVNEANLRNQVRISIKEALQKGNHKEAIEDLKSLKEIVPAELSDTHSKIEDALSKINEKMEHEIKNSTECLKEKESKLDELKAKYETANATIQELKTKYGKAKELIEKVGKNSEGVKALKESAKKMLEDINKLVEHRKIMLGDIKQLMIDRKGMFEDLNVIKKKYKEKIEESKKSESEKELIRKQLKVAEQHAIKLEKILEDEFGYEFEDDADEEIIDAASDGYESGFEDGLEAGQEDALETDDIFDDDLDVIDEPVDIDEPMLVDDDDDDFMYEEEEDKKDDEEDKKDDEKKDDEKDMKESVYVFGGKEKLAESVPVKKPIKKIAPVTNKKEVVQYYKEAVQKNPAVRDIKKYVLNAKSVLDAVKIVESFKSKKSEMIEAKGGLKKSSTDGSWLGHRL